MIGPCHRVLLHHIDNPSSKYIQIHCDTWLETPRSADQSTVHSTLCSLTSLTSLLLHSAKRFYSFPSRAPIVTRKLKNQQIQAEPILYVVPTLMTRESFSSLLILKRQSPHNSDLLPRQMFQNDTLNVDMDLNILHVLSA